VRQLLADGVQVRALVRRTTTAHDLNALAVELVEGDLRTPEPWAPRLRGCDTVFHVAALYSADPADAPGLYAVNVGGTQAVLQAAAAAGVGRVVHTSTIGAIGRPPDGSLPTERTTFNLWATASNYVRSKWLGEAAALWWQQRGLPVVVVHPTAPVGSGDRKPTATGQRIVDFLAGRRPDYPAGGMNLCPVQDIAQGHLLAARHGQPGERYILGHQQGNLDETGFLQLLSEISGGRGFAPQQVRRSQPPKGGSRPLALTADPSRAIVELGLPQSDLRTALAEAVAFFRGA
jgi:dihydroflavonol-4-reductase